MRSQTPKMLHEVCGRSLIGWVVAAAKEADAGKLVVVVGPDHVVASQLPENVVLAVQERSRGTADAVLSAAEHWADETVVVLSGDTPLITPETIIELIAAHDRAGAAGTLMTVELDDAGSLGRIVRGADGSFERVVETKAGAPQEISAIREANAGVYAFDGATLEDALRRVRSDNDNGEAYLPTCSACCARTAASSPTMSLTIRRHCSASTTASTSRRTSACAQERINAEHMRAGVTIVDPATTYIEVGVTIGARHDDRAEQTLRERRRSPPAACSRNAYVDVGGRSTRASRSGRSPTCAPAHACCAPAPRRALRRDQELRARRGREGAAPELRRRRRHRRRQQSRRSNRSPPTTTAGASTARRSART